MLVRFPVSGLLIVAAIAHFSPAVAQATSADDSSSGSASAASPTAVPAENELVDTVKTSQSRSKLSQFLVLTAEKHRKVRAWAKAIPLYQALVVARGPASADAEQLAKLWTLAGQNEEAATVWRGIAAGAHDDALKARADAEITRLAKFKDPFADKLQLQPQPIEARRSFALGRTAFGAKKYGDALVFFHMGYALAPDLPGFLRELGATYDKLGATDRKREFYQRYLLQRPFGTNADLVRKDLKKSNAELGTLSISSSLPCTELWINRQRLIGPMPQGGITVAPGVYKGLCFVPRYEMALFEYATVAAGASAELSFRWAVIVNKLEKPLGRIAIENPKSPGVMMDLGVSSLEIGVALPPDDRKLRVQLRDDAGTRSEERFIRLEPGQRQVLQW
jgi:tetratricopeptide (TPR) repeat protein